MNKDFSGCGLGDGGEFDSIVSEIGKVSSAVAPMVTQTIGAISSARQAKRAAAASSGFSMSPAVAATGGMSNMILPLALGGVGLAVLFLVLKKKKSK